MNQNRILSFILSFVMCLTIVGTFPTMVEAAWSLDKYYQDSMDAFDKFDYSDKQFLPDEEFFGVWDAEAGDWKEGYVPYFYYEEYPELSAVEEAAKNGDYETCKEEILAYYREKSSHYNMGYTKGTLSDLDRARAELQITGIGDTWGRTYFTTKAGWHGIPLNYVVSNRLGTGKKKQIYALCTTTKDGYRVEIDRTEDYVPYMTVVINGEKKTYKATKTTYVDGNITDARNLDPDKLMIEESVTSIGKLFPRDENTKRTFLQFDFDDLAENDAAFMSSATLYLYGKVVEDDIDEYPPFERDYKMVHAFEWNFDTELNPAFTYEKMNEYSEIFYCIDGEEGQRRCALYYNDTSGVDYSAIFSVANLTNAYTVTGDEFFAWHAIRRYCANANYYGSFEHFDNMKPHPHGLGTTSGWGYGQIWNIDAIINSQYMTPDAFTLLLKTTHVRGQWLEKNWIGSYENVNWGGYGVKGILGISMMYPEFRASHGDLWRNEDGSLYLETPEYGGSVRGGWLEVANYRNSYKVGANMHDDGTSFEAPIGYSFESLSAYLTPKEFGEKLNFDYSIFYTPKVEDESDYIYVGRERMKRALLYLASISTPQGGHFQVGDAGAWTDDALANFKKGYLDYIQDDAIDYIVYKGEKGKKPDFTTIVHDGDIPEGEEGRGGKVAVFRNAWDESAIAMMFQAWGKANHSHQDDLSLSLVAYGNYLLTDQRMNKYVEEEPLERWVSSTRGHNVVEINDSVGRGPKQYAVQYEPYVFAYDQNEDGEYVPRKDENGVEMIDDQLWVDVGRSNSGTKSGTIHPEDREINNVYDYVRGSSYTYEDCGSYGLFNEDFDYDRNVLFLRSGYFVVTDYAKPQFGLEYKYQDDYMKEKNIEGHKYKQIWHFTNEANIEIDEEKNSVKTHFPDAANIVIATVKNNDNMHVQYKYGLYPIKRGIFEVSKYATFQQYKKGAMTFNTLLYPTPVGEEADVTTHKIDLGLPEDKANAFKATVTDVNRNIDTEIYFYTLLDKELKEPVIFSAYETDGTLALGEKKQGKYVNAVLRQGSYLENILDNEYPVYAKEEVEDIGVYWQNDEIDIAYDTNDSYNNTIDLSKITVIANNKVAKVRLNGNEIQFKQDGKYIYFGDEPILDGGDIIPGTSTEDEGTTPGTGSDNGNDSADGGHASMGGGGGGGGGSSSSSTDKKDEEKTEEKPADPETELTPMPSDEYSKELEGHWAKEEISSLVDNAVIQGYGDGTLGLDRNITRAQFITMLVRALGVPLEKYSGSFGDVSATIWHADYIETALKNGWIQGDGTNVHPDRNITREEITKILVAAYEQKYGEITTLPESGFTDSADISSWASEFVEKAVGAGLVNGMGDGTFSPKTNAKREQAMVLVHRLINSEKTKTEEQE